MRNSRIERWYFAPLDQIAILHKLADRILAEDEAQSVPDWEIISPEIGAEVQRQAADLLVDAAEEYDAFEKARVRAAREYGRADPLVCGLAGAIAAYIICVLFLPRYLAVARYLPATGVTALVIIFLVAALAARWLVWRGQRRTVMRAAQEAYLQWVGVLQDQVLRPYIVEKRNDEARNPRLFDVTIGDKSPPRLIEGSEPKGIVITETITRARATARNIHSGSLGISGPRGVGKTTILRFFSEDDGKDLRVVVPAPVDYEPREFIVHLYSQLCEAVPHSPSSRSPIATETRHRLEELKYLRTYTTTWSASLKPRAFLELARSFTKQRAEQPFTLPDLVESFRRYSAMVAAWQQSVHGSDGRLVIAIDEIDKIRDGDRAETFLNDIKAIFGVPGCLYVVSLSEDALTGFARRTPTIRTAFDSSFDDIQPVGPMTYQHSEGLLFKRIIGVPRPFLALSHVLAGGLPRDLVRAARALIDVTLTTGEKGLADMSGALVQRELESLRQSAVRQLADSGGPAQLLAALHDRHWPGRTPHQFTQACVHLKGAAKNTDDTTTTQLCQELIVSLSFYKTVLELFGDAPDHLINCLKDQRYDIIDDLAAARYAMRVNVELAHQLLEQYRLRTGMGHDRARI